MAIRRILKNPRIGPYGFEIYSASYIQCVEWCEKEFGKQDDRRRKTRRWESRDRRWVSFSGVDYGKSAIYFNSEEDAVAFKLRWL